MTPLRARCTCCGRMQALRNSNWCLKCWQTWWASVLITGHGVP